MAQPLLQRTSASAIPSVSEEALQCFGALMNAPGLGVALVDRELTFRYVNASLITLSGQPGSAYEGRTVAEAWPGLAATLGPLLTRVLAGESVMRALVGGYLGPVKPPGARQYRVSLQPTGTGSRAGVVLTLEDDTERMEKERAVRESEERLRSLVAVSCDGYFLHDGNEVLEVNPSLARLMGATPEEMVRQPISRFIAPESRETVQRALARQVVSPYEATGLRSDGRRLFLEVLAQQTEHHGRSVRLVAMWDISARKAAEEAASRADTFREQLLGVVGHDLRSPLSTLQMCTQGLERSGLSETQAKHVEHMAAATQRMQGMIHELMDFTRARLAGGIPVRAEPGSLETVLKHVVEGFQVSHPARLILCQVEGEMRGTWDGGRLTQLLDNLVGNALRHSPPDTPVEVRLAAEGEGVVLSVRNQGAPVPLEERATLFEPFKRGKRAQGDGLGLGLYIARQIALAHGGRISVESGVGLGTRFVTWLPRHAPGT